jgi:hypothetical protein
VWSTKPISEYCGELDFNIVSFETNVPHYPVRRKMLSDSNSLIDKCQENDQKGTLGEENLA